MTYDILATGSGEKQVSNNVSPCPVCGSFPMKETREVMLGNLRDGGYPCVDGRYFCPTCGFGPTWGQSYSIYFGWDRNAEVWEKMVERYAV